MNAIFGIAVYFCPKTEMILLSKSRCESLILIWTKNCNRNLIKGTQTKMNSDKMRILVVLCAAYYYILLKWMKRKKRAYQREKNAFKKLLMRKKIPECWRLNSLRDRKLKLIKSLRNEEILVFFFFKLVPLKILIKFVSFFFVFCLFFAAQLLYSKWILHQHMTKFPV